MAFHEDPSQEAGRQLIVSHFYLCCAFPSPSKVVDHFEYLGLCLDPKLLYAPAVSVIFEKAKKEGAKLRCGNRKFTEVWETSLQSRRLARRL